jgi:hypothetical protein
MIISKHSAISFFSLLLVFVFSITIISCEEEGPFIDMTPPNTSLADSSYIDSGNVTAQQRNILIEDFSGVKCPNCPFAQQKAEAIETANPGRIVTVVIHPSTPSFDPLTKPFPISTRDFRNKFGTLMMESSVGPPANLPSGSVNRIKYGSPLNSRTYGHDYWESVVNTEKAKSTPLNLDITNTFDAGTRELLVTVKAQYNTTATDPGFHHLTLLLIESDIISIQDYPTHHDTFYVHKHVLDSVITPIGGVPLNKDKVKGRTYVKQYKITVPEKFVAANCEIVAIAHKDAANVEVVHVTKKHLF